MPLGYCDQVHRPLAANDATWDCTVGFLGGWEPRRERLLHEVVASGADLKIWGGYWDFLKDGRWSFRRQIILRQLAGEERFRFHSDALLEVYGDDYARALTGARIGLRLLRQVCPDQHTTRTFEIPACGGMLLADRTDEHLSFFKKGKEAEFFTSGEELIDKIKFYSYHHQSRQQPAQAGRKRCVEGQNAYIHRLDRAMKCVETA